MSRWVGGEAGRFGQDIWDAGYPVLLELTLINEEIQVYTDDKKRDNLCKLLSDAIGQSVKIVIKPKELKAGEKPKQAPAKQKSKQKANDSAVLEAWKCEIAEAIELRQLGTRSSLHGVWMVLRYGVESPEHATAFVSQLCQPEVLQLLEETITHKMWTTPEEKSRRAREPKRTPVWARLNKQAPAWSSVASIDAELQMLRGLAHRYPHFFHTCRPISSQGPRIGLQPFVSRGRGQGADFYGLDLRGGPRSPAQSAWRGSRFLLLRLQSRNSP
jgi:hypothetical protein